MSLKQPDIAQLIQNSLDGTISQAELDELIAFAKNEDSDLASDPAVLQLLAQYRVQDAQERSFWKNQLAEMPMKITGAANQADQQLPLNEDAGLAVPVHRVHFLKTTWFRYAAVILGVMIMGAYLWFQNNREQTLADNNKPVPVDIQPGKEGAVLTLADGSQLALDSLNDGLIAEENGSRILLLDGKMSYAAEGKGTADLVYNTLSTPKGRQFQFKLPDGTNVWLNAASSIRYPTAFSGKDRRVEVKGEAYFDVAKNAQKTFIVETDIMDIQVLGTEFNVNSYSNEAYIQTTLINGLVKLIYIEDRNRPTDPTPDSFKLLNPGKQATINRQGVGADPIKVTDAANIDQVIAWKEGRFNFDKVDLFNLMRQLERWYNIEVEYRGDVKNITFRGKMYRNVNLSDVLRVLTRMGVSFEQEGNKLIVKTI